MIRPELLRRVESAGLDGGDMASRAAGKGVDVAHDLLALRERLTPRALVEVVSEMWLEGLVAGASLTRRHLTDGERRELEVLRRFLVDPSDRVVGAIAADANVSGSAVRAMAMVVRAAVEDEVWAARPEGAIATDEEAVELACALEPWRWARPSDFARRVGALAETGAIDADLAAWAWEMLLVHPDHRLAAYISHHGERPAQDGWPSDGEGR